MRRFFWNFTTAFVGWPMIKMAPTKMLFYPVVVGVPLYLAISL